MRQDGDQPRPFRPHTCDQRLEYRLGAWIGTAMCHREQRGTCHAGPTAVSIEAAIERGHFTDDHNGRRLDTCYGCAITDGVERADRGSLIGHRAVLDDGDRGAWHRGRR